MAVPEKVVQAFGSWVDSALGKRIPKETVAFHFNLYEGVDSVHVQLTGSKNFSLVEQDWPCDTSFTTGEDIFEVPFKYIGREWPQWLEALKAMVTQYVASGTKSPLLRESKGVGVGFVDGDVHVVWSKTAA